MKDLVRLRCIENLENSQSQMLAALESVPAAAFNKNNLPDIWSVAQIIDHVIQIEQTIVASLQKLSPDQSNSQERPTRSHDEVMRLSADRTLKSKAPEAFLPKGNYPDKDIAIKAFKTTRNTTIEFVRSTSIDLVNIIFPHPRLGTLNGENWLVFIAGHSLKHVAQIKEMF